MLNKIIILACYLIQFSLHAFTQTVEKTPLSVGMKMPDITFDNVDHYSKKQVSTSDFRGRWLILDYWTAFCSTCIESQPRMDTLQRAFKDDVTVLLVGLNGVRLNRRSDSLIRNRFEKQRRDYTMELAIAYDSLTFDRFDIWATPYIIVVDKKGIIRAITTRIDQQQTKALLAGKQVVFDKALSRSERRREIEEKYRKKIPRDVNR